MSPALVAALGSWSLRPLPLALLALTWLVYLRGWRALRRQMPTRFPPWRLAAFTGSLAALAFAIASPLDALGGYLLSVHMVQHLALTMIAAPLFWLAAPQIPLLRGLPRTIGKDLLGPFLWWPELRRLFGRVTHPLVAWFAFVLATWIWHWPSLYELALRSSFWHEVEHAFFFLAALLFWWPVVQPWPSVPVWPRWAMIPYLALADLQNTAFSALFAFSDRVIYSLYAAAPRLSALDALEDQSLAGAVMWVPGQVAFLAPVVVILIRLLSPPGLTGTQPVTSRPRLSPWRAAQPSRAPRARSSGRFDVLALPRLGRLLASLATRRVAQVVLLALAAAVVVDGFLGPTMSPMNLAGVLPWTYFRGLSVIALLVAANAFCFACPFMLPREAAKRLFAPTRRLPRALRSKWLAVGILVALLAAYESFDWWDDPRATAWIVVSYFLGAFAVDALFRGATFCKFACPIGQFHFVTSTLSPLEVAVRDADTCARCTTHDCLRGRGPLRGCETDLFLPHKVGNLDCTFCLDCVRACPHDNVGLLAVTPALDLTRDVRRSSLGRLSRRPDVGALAVVFAFGAFANAAGMIEPFLAAEAFVGRALGVEGSAPQVSILVLAAVVALPLLAVTVCAEIGRRVASLTTSRREIATRFALAVIPLGAGMWAAHLLFHLATGATALAPVVQRVAADLGAASLAPASWSAVSLLPEDWLVPAKLLLLDAGLCATIAVAWRVATQLAPSLPRVAGAFAPWAILSVALWLSGIWILLQPMQMRGTMVH